MKKYLSTLLIVAVAVGFVSIGASKAVAHTEEKGYISVSTTANTELPPDVVEISIAVQTEDEKSLQKATTENKLISDKVYAALTEMINNQDGDYVKTTNFNASPVYNYKNGKKTLTKYQVSNNVIVHTKAIGETGKMIDKAIALGATNVNSVDFSVSSYDKQCDELLLLASKKAYTRAQLLAGSAGNTLVGIKSFNGSCSTTNYGVQYRAMAKNLSLDPLTASAGTEDSASPIQAGVIKLFANLNAAYFVK